MRVRLTLAQVTALIDKAELTSELASGVIRIPVSDLESPISEIGDKLVKGISPVIALAEAIVALKTAAQEELQSTQIRLDAMIKELKDHGYTEITEQLDKVKIEVEIQSRKTQDKYFDKNGAIKPKGHL
jgi:hypothetical protein